MLYLFWLLTGVLKAERASVAGMRLMQWLGPKTHRHRTLLANLELAFPELDEDERERLARKIWGNFGSVLAEYPHLDRFAPGESPAGFELQIDPESRVVIESHRAAVYVSAHTANWELVGVTLTGLGVSLSVIYGPQSNPILEQAIQKQRRRLGCRLVPKDQAMRRLVRELRSGRSVGLLPDQRLDSGESLPFFGLNTPTGTSPGRLAARLHCPVIPVQVQRLQHGRYRVRIHAPLTDTRDDGSRRDAIEISTELNRLFEGWIRQHPEQWLCLKRRWPKAFYAP